MSQTLSFYQLLEKDFKTLEVFLPIVTKVHAKEHPEFAVISQEFNRYNSFGQKEGVWKFIPHSLSNYSFGHSELNKIVKEHFKLRRLTSPEQKVVLK